MTIFTGAGLIHLFIENTFIIIDSSTVVCMLSKKKFYLDNLS